MQIKLESHGITVTVSSQYNDVTISEWFEAFRTCLIGISFVPEQIDNYIIEKANELEEESEDYGIESCKD